MRPVREAGKTFFDDEGGHALRPGLHVGLGVDHQSVGVAAIGDPHFRAVENVAVALLFGAQPHRDDVGTRARLGHGQGADMLAGKEFRQIFGFLRRRGVAPDLVDAKVGMGAIGQADRGRGARNLLQRDDMGEIAHVGAAVLLRDRHAEQAEVAEFLPEIGGKFIVAVDLFRAGRDFGQGEGAHAVAQHVDLVAESEIQARNGHGNGLPSEADFAGAALFSAAILSAVPAPRTPIRLHFRPS